MATIIDAHHHLWLYNSVDYGWMDESMEVLRRDYTPADLKKEMEKSCAALGVTQLTFLGHIDPTAKGYRVFAPDVSSSD